MNLGAALRWCEMVLWQLDHPASEARQGITVDRMDKSLEGQHSKGGFTSLLASFGALLQDCSAAQVRASFGRTSVKDVKQWVANNLGKTLASRKQSAYRRSLAPAPGS